MDRPLRSSACHTLSTLGAGRVGLWVITSTGGSGSVSAHRLLDDARVDPFAVLVGMQRRGQAGGHVALDQRTDGARQASWPMLGVRRSTYSAPWAAITPLRRSASPSSAAADSPEPLPVRGLHIAACAVAGQRSVLPHIFQVRASWLNWPITQSSWAAVVTRDKRSPLGPGGGTAGRSGWPARRTSRGQPRRPRAAATLAPVVPRPEAIGTAKRDGVGIVSGTGG